MPGPNIINAGLPVTSSAPSVPAWWEKCPASPQDNKPNTLAPADRTVSFSSGAFGGAAKLQFKLTDPYAIERVTFAATWTSKMFDKLTAVLKDPGGTEHIIFKDRIMQGSLVTTNPYTQTIVRLPFDATPPKNSRFYRNVGTKTDVEVSVLQGETPPDGGVFVRAESGGASYITTMLAHRAPFVPVAIDTYSGLALPLTTLGVNSYISKGQRVTLKTKDFVMSVVGTIVVNTNIGDGVDELAVLTRFSEQLWAKYGIHDYRMVTNIEGFVTYDTYIAGDLQWEITPLERKIYKLINYPEVDYEIIPDAASEHEKFSKRSLVLSETLHELNGKSGEGLWTLELSGAPAESFNQNPGVLTAAVELASPVVTFYYKQNQAYQSSVIVPVSSGGTDTCEVTGTLMLSDSEISSVGIFLGIDGSSKMGLWCGYSVVRKSLSEPIYDVSLFIKTTCNLSNVSLERVRQSISYKDKNWLGDHTKGNEARGHLLPEPVWSKWPVTGPITLQARLIGRRVEFEMMGDYPVLVWEDASVALIDTYLKVFRNA
jgi:hypothetical protein